MLNEENINNYFMSQILVLENNKVTKILIPKWLVMEFSLNIKHQLKKRYINKKFSEEIEFIIINEFYNLKC